MTPDLWDLLSDFWDKLDPDDREKVEVVWDGYIKMVNNLYLKLFSLDAAKSLKYAPIAFPVEWYKLRLDESTLFSHTPGTDYPYVYNINPLILDIVALRDKLSSTGYSEFLPDTDFKILSAGKLGFKEEPPTVLWATRLTYDAKNLWRVFGHPIRLYGRSSQHYKDALQAVWYVLLNGTTLYAVTRALNVLMRFPYAAEEGRVQSVSGSVITMESGKTYDVSPYSPIVSAGESVNVLDPLSNAVIVFDYISRPEFWDESEYTERLRFDNFRFNETWFDKYISVGGHESRLANELSKYHTFYVQFHQNVPSDVISDNIDTVSGLLSRIRHMHTKYAILLSTSTVDVLIPKDETPVSSLAEKAAADSQWMSAFCFTAPFETVQPLMHWKFDEGEGTTTTCAGQLSLTAPLVNAEWAPGKYNLGLSFAGGGNITANYGGVLNAGYFSLCFWLNPTQAVSGTVVELENVLSVKVAGEFLQFVLYDTAFRTTLLYGWNHYALVYDGTSVFIYVNGELTESSALLDFEYDVTPGNNIVIGEGYYGVIDEVVVYNRPLRPDWVALVRDDTTTFDASGGVGSEVDPPYTKALMPVWNIKPDIERFDHFQFDADPPVQYDGTKQTIWRSECLIFGGYIDEDEASDAWEVMPAIGLDDDGSLWYHHHSHGLPFSKGPIHGRSVLMFYVEGGTLFSEGDEAYCRKSFFYHCGPGTIYFTGYANLDFHFDWKHVEGYIRLSAYRSGELIASVEEEVVNIPAYIFTECTHIELNLNEAIDTITVDLVLRGTDESEELPEPAGMQLAQYQLEFGERSFLSAGVDGIHLLDMRFVSNDIAPWERFVSVKFNGDSFVDTTVSPRHGCYPYRIKVDSAEDGITGEDRFGIWIECEELGNFESVLIFDLAFRVLKCVGLFFRISVHYRYEGKTYWSSQVIKHADEEGEYEVTSLKELAYRPGGPTLAAMRIFACFGYKAGSPPADCEGDVLIDRFEVRRNAYLDQIERRKPTKYRFTDYYLDKEKDTMRVDSRRKRDYKIYEDYIEIAGGDIDDEETGRKTFEVTSSTPVFGIPNRGDEIQVSLVERTS